MDMNYLYQRRGEERLRAEVAACDPSRTAHLDLADRFGVLIRHARTSAGGEPGLAIVAPRD